MTFDSHNYTHLNICFYLLICVLLSYFSHSSVCSCKILFAFRKKMSISLLKIGHLNQFHQFVWPLMVCIVISEKIMWPIWHRFIQLYELERSFCCCCVPHKVTTQKVHHSIGIHLRKSIDRYICVEGVSESKWKSNKNTCYDDQYYIYGSVY